jgi:beta-glucosidase
VLSSGKPVTFQQEPEYAALVQQFYPGEQGGSALADVLFGVVNPSGKLPVSFPHSVGTLPVFYNYLKGSRIADPGMAYSNGTLVFGHQYVLSTPQARWPFGHGLSYTEFSFGEVGLDRINVNAADTVQVSVEVENTGKREGKVVVQVYVTDKVSSVVTPNAELKGFEKVMLKAGEKRMVKIGIEVEKLGVWGVDGRYKVEKGEFVVGVGDSSGGITRNQSFWVV